MRLHTLFVGVLFGIACFLPIVAEDTKAAPTASDAGAASSLASKADLEKLVARIALFPDPLIAQILPASTYPLEIVEAARFTKGKESLAKSKPEDFQKEVDGQKWEDSVKVVAMCPDALKLLNDDLDWTQKLGEAFLAQPEDLMQAIQNLRAKARASGALQDTDQQTFLVEDEGILIIPSDPDTIYVPEYDSQAVYAQQLPAEIVVEDDDNDVVVARPIGSGLIRFGAGLALGAWLSNDCRWGAHAAVYNHGYPNYGYAHQARLVHYGSANMANYDKVKKKMSHIDRTKLDSKYGKINGAPVTKARYPAAKPTPYTDSQGKWQHTPEHRRGQSYQNTKAAERAQLAGEDSRARLQDANRTGWGDKSPSRGGIGQEKPATGAVSSRANRESRPEISDFEAFGTTDFGATTREESRRGNESFDRSGDAYVVGRRGSRPPGGAQKPAQLPASGGGRGGGGGRR